MMENAAPLAFSGGTGNDSGDEETAEQLQRHLQKVQRTNAELIAELDSAQRTLARLRSERNYLMDKVYEREVATLEFTSGSSDEEETLLPSVSGSLSGTKTPLGGKTPLVFHHVRTPSIGSSGGGSSGTNGTSGLDKRPLHSEDEEEEEEERSGDEFGKDADRQHQKDARKKKRVVKSAEAAAATPRKALAVPTDEHGQPVLPLTVGVITLHSLGSVVWDRPAFHNKRYIWPPGFHTSRPYNSCIDAEAQTVYHSTIADGGSGPIFDVYADDNPDQHFQAPTPTGAWTAIVKQVNALRGREYTNSASGPDFFGLSNSTISMLIERLADADKCAHYQRKTFSTVPMATGGGTTSTAGTTAILAGSGSATPDHPSADTLSPLVVSPTKTTEVPGLATIPRAPTTVAESGSSLDVLSSAAVLPPPPPARDVDLEIDEPTS